MVNLFLRVLNMSLSASAVIAVVVLIRLLLRSAPKKWRYFLWSAAAFRLCCPVSYKAFFSIFRLRPSAVSAITETENLAPAAQTAAPAAQPVFPNIMVPAAYAVPATTTVPISAAEPIHFWPDLCMILWLCGIAVMLALGIIRYIRMKRLLDDAAALEPGVFATDRIRVPFILGLLPPRIYVPAVLDAQEAAFVLAHERVHIRRGDHWSKLLAYVLLAVHWFNPAVWAAFFLMSRDMEMSCDERVLRDLSGSATAYSRTLLRFAEGRQFPAPAPLGFGESDAGSRIKNALRWKRPKLWITLAAIVLCIAVIAACTADPKEPKEAAAPEARDTISFVREGQAILMRSGEERSFRDVLDQLSLSGFSYDEQQNVVRLEDKVFPGDFLAIGMRKKAAITALYASPPGDDRSSESAAFEPGVKVGNGTGGYYRISGLYAGEPFRMTLRYNGEDLLFLIQMDFYPGQDREEADQLFERLKEALTTQLGKPEAEAADPGSNAPFVGWSYPNGALTLQLTEKENVMIVLSGEAKAETPWNWSSTIKASDIREASLWSKRLERRLSAEQIEELTALLNAVPRENVAQGRGIPSDWVLQLWDTGYALRFEGGVIELDFLDSETAERYGPAVWEFRDEALYAWLDALRTEEHFEQRNESLGLTMNVQDATSTGCSLVFIQSGGELTGELSTGLAFLLEVQAPDGVWEELPGLREAAWYAVGYIIPHEGRTTLKTDWENILGPLEDGHYRIIKEVMDSRGAGGFDQFTISAEFDILGGAGKTLPGGVFDDRLGAERFNVWSEEHGTSASGTIEIYGKDRDTLSIRILADLQIGPEDWGGVAFSLPAGCELKQVSCTYPETDGEPCSDPPVNVWTTASDIEKYTTLIEIGRDRSQIPSGGGEGKVVIEASYPRENGEEAYALPFGVECGVEVKNGYVTMGADYCEIIVEIRPES